MSIRILLVICSIALTIDANFIHPERRLKREIELQEPLRNAFINQTKTGVLLQERVLPFDTDEVRPIPVSIEIKVGSTLWSEPGTPGLISFEITNNMRLKHRFEFNVNDNANYIKDVEPRWADIQAGGTQVVRVRLESRQRGSSPDIVTLAANWRIPQTNTYESVTKKSSDTSIPDIWYTYSGADCSGATSPQNCNAKKWRADIQIQDKGSGILRIQSLPVGLILKKEFIAGTRDLIDGFYTASCCHSKVDIIATDVLGNTRTYTIDIERSKYKNRSIITISVSEWLSAGEISAIVLGSILGLLIIIAIIFFIVRSCRKKQRTLNIYASHRVRPDN